MKIPIESQESLLEVKKSKFKSRIHYVESRSEAQDIISDVKQSHPQSNHVVYAFVIGDEWSEILGMTDDGEPKGTSGRPTMEVLRGSGIRNALLTTVRYFGGTKLGTGGLVKAYTRAAQLAVESCTVEEKKEKKHLRLELSYGEFEEVARRMKDLAAEIVNTEFHEEVCVEIDVENQDLSALENIVQDISRGRRTLRDR
ncbi:YigZ family protein [Salinispira pacifica]|uniref:Protein co-occurring with transport system n=1 Tax=Salinispira pacifica TaxID=1307761 RepID=V5WNU9_9SPIO|nr:YigZ family protein [Salinispira pacifica]AHC16841.1 protein co-occurring with transport system [Salinispira pacifica]